MQGLDPKFCIISYAVLTAKFNENKSIVKSFTPLLEVILGKIDSNITGKKKVSALFFEMYGFNIPLPILDDLLNILESQLKIKKLKNEMLEIYHSMIEEYDSSLELRLRILINEFDRFAKMKDFFVDRESISSLFSTFIYENAIEMNSFFKYSSDFETTSLDNNQYEKIIVEFLLRERSNCSDCYKFIEEIFSGAIISSLLQLGEKEITSIEDDPFNIEDVLLDSNFIFRVLDLQTSYECMASLETLKLLKDNHCKLWVSPCTVQQICYTITSFMNDIAPSTSKYNKYYDENKFSGLYSACFRRQLTPAKLQEIKNSIEVTLKNDFEISVFDKAVTDEIGIKTDEISSLQVAKPSSSTRGIIHDLQILLTVRNQRDSTITRTNQAKWWVLTDDYKLAKWCHYKKNKSTIPECLTESQVATLYWLKNPQTTSTTGLCNAILALRNKELFNSAEYKKITKEIENQKMRFEKNPQKLDRLALAFSSQCLSFDDLVSVKPDEADDLFDSKLAAADSFVQENQVLIKMHTSLQETAQQFALKLEKSKVESGDKSTIIREEINRHVGTLRLWSDEKIKSRDRLQKEYNDLKIRSEEAKDKNNRTVITRLVIACILITGLCVVTELKTNIFKSLQSSLPVSLSVFSVLFIFIIVILLGANGKAQIPTKLFDKISYSCYLRKEKKGKIPNYDDEIQETKKQLDTIILEIVNIENQIEEKLSA